MLVGAEDTIEAVGECGCFACNAAVVVIATVCLSRGDKARAMPIEERGRELEAVDVHRSLETALTGLIKSKVLASSTSVNADAERDNACV